jgi:hypothetical protein
MVNTSVCVEDRVVALHLIVGDLVKFKVMVTMVEDEEEAVIKIIKIHDGTESCHVGFLSQNISYGSHIERGKNMGK